MEENEEDRECCPKFDPLPWDNTILEWNSKRFIKDRVLTLFYMPLNFGSVMRKIMKNTSDAGASVVDNLCLSDHTSKWNMDIFLATDKEVEGYENVTMSGHFYSRVYEGDFKETGNWCADYEAEAGKKNLGVDKYYMWYTTCPKCARKYGKNYVAIIGETKKEKVPV